MKALSTVAWRWVILVLLLILLPVWVANAAGAGVRFKTMSGEVPWENNGVSVKEESGTWELVASGQRFPAELKWNWYGQGEVWAAVTYSDKNVLYYVLEGCNPPQVEGSTFIDQQGVPRIILPRITTLPEGKIRVNLLEDYHRYFGSRQITVESFKFGVAATGATWIKDFAVLQENRRDSATEESPALRKGIYLAAQIPQGNEGNCFLLQGIESPVQVKLRTWLAEDAKGSLLVRLPETMRVATWNRQKMRMTGRHTLILPLAAKAGYAEASCLFGVVADGPGEVTIEAVLGAEKKVLKRSVASFDLLAVRNGVSLLEEGVYPIQRRGHEETGQMRIRKEMKNNIRVKEDVFDKVHRLFGTKEAHEDPAGLIAGVIENNTGFDLPLHIRFAVLDRNGQEVPYFRGEHIQREGAEEVPVPETVLTAPAAQALEFKMPIFADAYSVKPGTYKGVLKVSLFGSNTELVLRQFNLAVKKESQVKTAAFFTAVLLSLVSVLLLILKQKRWLSRLRTSEVILIALFTAVKFSIVDIPWFIFGDVIRAFLGPLGPFMSIFTGIFWDILNSLFLVTLIVLIPKSGVVIISSAVRIVLGAIAFGSFNPISILLMLSYAAIADLLLYLAGFTSGKREFKECLPVFGLVAGIFALQHLYSTYISYYMMIYLYRLFFPDWYINVNALISVIYSAVGAILGVFLGNKLRRVIE